MTPELVIYRNGAERLPGNQKKCLCKQKQPKKIKIKIILKKRKQEWNACFQTTSSHLLMAHKSYRQAGKCKGKARARAKVSSEKTQTEILPKSRVTRFVCSLFSFPADVGGRSVRTRKPRAAPPPSRAPHGPLTPRLGRPLAAAPAALRYSQGNQTRIRDQTRSFHVKINVLKRT